MLPDQAFETVIPVRWWELLFRLVWKQGGFQGFAECCLMVPGKLQASGRHELLPASDSRFL